MGATLFLAVVALAPDPWDPAAGVCLSDARRFPVPPAVARRNWQLSVSHPALVREEVRAWNTPADFGTWENETAWRRACWDHLDTVLYHRPASLEWKLRALGRLRELLGDEAYFAGRMPAPIPTYRTAP